MTKIDITNIIAEKTRQANPELEERLAAQADALAETKCTQPILGRWVDAFDVKFLLAGFALSDRDFGLRFPGLDHLKESQRRQIIAMLESHFNVCQHCSLKRGYDIELDDSITRAVKQNRESLLSLLRPAVEPIAAAATQSSQLSEEESQASANNGALSANGS